MAQDGQGDDFIGLFGTAGETFNVPDDDCGSLRAMGSSNIGRGPGSGLVALELNLEQGGFLTHDNRIDHQVGREWMQQHNINNNMTNLFSSLGHLQPRPPSLQPSPPPHRPKPHPLINLQNPVRRERIAERMKALQELVPSCNKTDRAAMLVERVDYVKFLRLQVKVLSKSRLGGAGAVAQLVADVPNPSSGGESIDDGQNRQAWEEWTTDGTEQEVAKLMEEDVGAAMQFLQSRALCIMPLSLASAIFRRNQPDEGL